MEKWVGLLRGVNVGGYNRVPMADLRAACLAAGWLHVQTYIASGNLLFQARGQASTLAVQLDDILQQHFGVATPSLVLSAEDLRSRLAQCPFPATAGKAVHGLFCATVPGFDGDRYDMLRKPSEQVTVHDKTVWLYAPDGVGQSKLFANIDKVVTGTGFTARNLNTITTLVEMLDG